MIIRFVISWAKYARQAVRITRSASLLVALLSAASCRSDGKNCTPGEQRTCPCLSGRQGIQICKDDGSGLLACEGCNLDSDARPADAVGDADAAGPTRQPLDLTNLVFDVPANWVNVDGYILKANNGTDQFAYLKQSKSGNSSLRVESHIEWHASGDLTGVILRAADNPTNRDGYYFLVYPYQSNYRILKVVSGAEQQIEEGSCQSDLSAGWESLAVKATTVQVSGQTYNRFDFYVSDQLATTVQDNSFGSWHLGFGKYNWYDANGGYALFSNITEP